MVGGEMGGQGGGEGGVGGGREREREREREKCLLVLCMEPLLYTASVVDIPCSLRHLLAPCSVIIVTWLHCLAQTVHIWSGWSKYCKLLFVGS